MRTSRMLGGWAAVVCGMFAALAAGCEQHAVGPRAWTHLEIASSVGGAREAAKWWSADLTQRTYPGADPRELARLRARLEIIDAQAQKLSERLEAQDMFAPGSTDPELESLAAWARDIDDQRIDVGRDLAALQVSLGMRPPEYFATRDRRMGDPVSDVR